MSRIRVPTEKNVRAAGYTVCRWYRQGAHSRYQNGWITDERNAGRGKTKRIECRVEFVDDRTRWIPKNELELITPESKRADAKARKEREAAYQEKLEARREKEAQRGRS